MMPAETPAKRQEWPHMYEVIAALYQAVQQNENHSATVNALLDVLRAARRNARKEIAGTATCDPRRATAERTIVWCEQQITHYTELLGTLHAERDDLRRKIKQLRG